MMVDIQHLSKSQINCYLGCPFQWYCKKVLNMKEKISPAMLVGKAGDDALNYAYRTKKDTGKLPTTSAVQDCFAQSFDLHRMDTKMGKRTNPDQLKDLGLKTVAEFCRTVCPAVDPVEVQKEGLLEFENVSYKIKVIIDVIATGDQVIDNKFSRKKWALPQAKQQYDPVIYSQWYEAEYGRKAGFRFDIGILGKKPKTQMLDVPVSGKAKMGFLKLVAYVHDSIKRDLKRGVFLPTSNAGRCFGCFCKRECDKEWGRAKSEFWIFGD